MNLAMKVKIRNKATLLYGLLTILKDEVDMLRSDANAHDIDNLNRSVKDTLETLEKMIDVIAELEYILYLDKCNTKRPD